MGVKERPQSRSLGTLRVPTPTGTKSSKALDEITWDSLRTERQERAELVEHLRNRYRTTAPKRLEKRVKPVSTFDPFHHQVAQFMLVLGVVIALSMVLIGVGKAFFGFMSRANSNYTQQQNVRVVQSFVDKGVNPLVARCAVFGTPMEECIALIKEIGIEERRKLQGALLDLKEEGNSAPLRVMEDFGQAAMRTENLDFGGRNYE